MTLAQADVEIVKLARLLGTEPEEIGYLRDVDWQDIRDVREQASATMFEGDRQQLQRVAVGDEARPVEDHRDDRRARLRSAAGRARHRPDRALPRGRHRRPPADGLPRRGRRAARPAPREPRHRGDPAAADRGDHPGAAARGDHVTMGRFVGHLSEAALRAALQAVDDESLLHTAYVVESKGALGALVAIIPERAPARHPAHGERVRPLARGARRPAPRLRRAARDARRHRRRAGRRRPRRPRQGRPARQPLGRRPAGRAGDGRGGRARFATLKPIQTRPVLSSIVDAATQRGLWPELLTLLPLLPAASRRRVAALGTGFGRSILAQIVRAAHEEGLWTPLLGFAVELEVRTQRDAVKLIRAADDEMLDGLLDALEAGRPAGRARRARRPAGAADSGATKRIEQRMATLARDDRSRHTTPSSRPARGTVPLWRGIRRTKAGRRPTARSAGRSGWTSTGRSTCAGCASRTAG